MILFDPIVIYNIRVESPTLTDCTPPDGAPLDGEALEVAQRANLEHLLAFQIPWAALEEAHQASWRQSLTAAFHEAFPKRKAPEGDSALLRMSAALNTRAPESGTRLKTAHQQASQAAAAAIEAAAELVKAKIAEIAGALKPHPGETWNVAETTSSRTWSSSGHQYGSIMAEIRAAFYRAAGLEARVDTAPQDLPDLWNTYRVLVRADPLDILIAKHTAPFTLRDAVKLCWKLGGQPRVFWPFLDPAFEAKNGLDYFGNELPARGAP